MPGNDAGRCVGSIWQHKATLTIGLRSAGNAMESACGIATSGAHVICIRADVDYKRCLATVCS